MGGSQCTRSWRPIWLLFRVSCWEWFSEGLSELQAKNPSQNPSENPPEFWKSNRIDPQSRSRENEPCLVVHLLRAVKWTNTLSKCNSCFQSMENRRTREANVDTINLHLHIQGDPTGFYTGNQSILYTVWELLCACHINSWQECW